MPGWTSMPEAGSQAVALCQAADLIDGGLAVDFDVIWRGEPCRAFAIRWRGAVHAYLNRCGHLPMEMDWQPNRFFDDSGRWLLCATHGAVYEPATGACAGGPCSTGLVKIEVSERDGVVHWHTDRTLQPVEFPA